MYKCCLLAVIMMTFTVLSAKEQLLYLFEENGLCGYKDSLGNVVIDAQFIAAQEFTDNGIAAVADSSGWIYIDKHGNYLIKPYNYDNGPDYFSEGLARFVNKGKIGFFDKTGNIVIEAQWDFAYPFKNGKAEVCNGCSLQSLGEHMQVTGGLWGLIDKTGQIVIPVGTINPDSLRKR